MATTVALAPLLSCKIRAIARNNDRTELSALIGLVLQVLGDPLLCRCETVLGRKEIADLAVQRCRNLIKAVGRDAAQAVFVFVHLLKRDPDDLGKLLLGRADLQSTSPGYGMRPADGSIGSDCTAVSSSRPTSA